MLVNGTFQHDIWNYETMYTSKSATEVMREAM